MYNLFLYCHFQFMIYSWHLQNISQNLSYFISVNNILHVHYHLSLPLHVNIIITCMVSDFQYSIFFTFGKCKISDTRIWRNDLFDIWKFKKNELIVCFITSVCLRARISILYEEICQEISCLNPKTFQTN